MLKKYKAFFKAASISTFAYKFNTFSWLLTMSFSCIWVIFMWTAVYSNSPDAVINGFNSHQMITYVVVVFIFQFTMGCSNTLDMMCDEIQKGQIAMFLIKPISYRLRFTFTTLGSLFSTNVFLTFPLLAIITVFFVLNGYIVITSATVFITHILLFLVSQIFAALLLDAINFFFGIICFYTLAIFGLFQIKDTIISFLSGALIPLAFFPQWAGKLLNYSPFAGMAQNPAMIFLGRMSTQKALFSIALQIIWIAILELIIHFLYNHAIKKITIQGG